MECQQNRMKDRTAGGTEIVHIHIENSSYTYVHSYTVCENLLVAPLERKLHTTFTSTIETSLVLMYGFIMFVCHTRPLGPI